MIFKVRNFDKQTCRDLRPELKKALEQFEKDFGVTVNVGGMKFSFDHAEIKLEVIKENALDPRAQEYVEMQRQMPNWPKLGEDILYNHRRYTVIGWNASARRYPVITTRAGLKFKMSRNVLRDKYVEPQNTTVTEVPHEQVL